MRVLILAFALTVCNVSFAQDTTTHNPIRLSVVAEHLYQDEFSTLEVMTRPNVSYGDLYTLEGIFNRPAYLSDNPLLHGATYAKLSVVVEPIHAVRLDAEIIAEHRGISYGVYNTRYIEFIPRLTLSFDTNIRIGSEKIYTRLSVGNFTNLKLQEGLTIYNLDAQGTDAEVQWRRMVLRVHNIGDLMYGIGLGINDLRTYLMEVRDVRMGSWLSVDGSVAVQPISDRNDALMITTALGLQRDSTRLYLSGSLNNRANSVAYLAGLSTGFSLPWIKLNSLFEYRYYDGNYHDGSRWQASNYRTDAGSPHLYPLELFNRRYSQWAVYEEYATDVEALNLLGELSIPIAFDLVLLGLMDLNVIWAGYASVDAFVLPFYRVGLGWSPMNGSEVSLSMTNRAMNLDLTYPTLYALKGAGMQVGLKISY